MVSAHFKCRVLPKSPSGEKHHWAPKKHHWPPPVCADVPKTRISVFRKKVFPFLGHPTKCNEPERHWMSFQICMKNEKIESILKMMTPQSVLSVSEEQ
jgi:hypothetical protein